MRVALGAAAGLAVVLATVACVDGKTPDCSTPASGCYPSDVFVPPPSDGGDAAADVTTPADAGPDGASPVDATVD